MDGLNNIFQQAGIDLRNLGGVAIDQVFSEALNRPGQVFSNEFNNIDQGGWNTNQYAQDLINYQPKHRFLFKVLFEVDPSLSLIELPNKNDFQYIIKEIDKPTLSFEYEEVNYYNFRTKVLKKINHEALSITVIDDISDAFYKFFMNYLNAYCPAARTWSSSNDVYAMQRGGFNFSDAQSQNPFDSAIRGELPNGIINPFKNIRVQQFASQGMILNEYNFVNPRILDFNFEQLSHEGGDAGNHCTIRFDYDFLKVATPSQSPSDPKYAVSGKEMHLNYNGTPNPMLDNFGYGSTNSYNVGDISPFSGNAGGGIIGGMASNIFNNIGNQVIGSAIRSVIPQSNIPGVGEILSNTSSAVQTVSQQTLFGMTRQFNPNLIQQSTPVIFDEFGS